MSIGGWVIAIVQKSKMADTAILHLTFVQCFGIPACRTFRVIHMPNFVQICAIVNELWTINEIQNGNRRHLEFIIFVHFGQMFYFRWQPSTLLQNFIYLRQSAAELLLFVQKFKMAATSILNFKVIQNSFWITPKIESLVVFAILDIPWKFQKNP